MISSGPPRILPPATASFLEQIADIPEVVGPDMFTYAASVVLPATGWHSDGFVARLAEELSQPQNLGILERAREEQQRGGFSPFSFSLSTAKGGRTNFLALPRPGLTPHGKPTVLVSLAAQAGSGPHESFLKEQSGILRLFDVLPAYVVLIDKQRVIRFSNRVGRRLFGHIVGMPCYRALHGRDEPCETCVPFSVLEDNAVSAYEWVNSRINTAFRTHSYPFDDVEGNRLLLQIGLNITAGVRARHALDLSEQRYRSIAENLTMGLALIDPQLNVVTLNPRMEAWFGEEAARGTSICELLHQRCCEEDDAVCLFRKVLADRKNHEKEFELRTAGGETRHFRLMGCPIISRGTEVRAIVMMLEDTTDRHDLAVRMQQVQRLEAMGTLAAGIAHEINQPLSALHLYASGLQMLLEQDTATSPDRIFERLTLILTQADKIRQIISHMRALVMQEEAPAVSPSSLRHAVSGALDLVGAQLRGHGIQVEVAIDDNVPDVMANPVQLEQVVINLLVNAMHALDTVERKEKHIRITAGGRSGEAYLLVADNGPGIESVRDRMFDPFFTTKEAHMGMGLGLSIVHAFISGWGGTIDALPNIAGPGAVFRITMHVAPEAISL